MTPYFHRRNLKLKEINARVRTDLAGFIAEESQRYADEIDRLARYLATELSQYGLVMLSGPSSAGKTTTANMLKAGLKQRGVEAYTISMDDFYRGREQAPILEDGSYDYEALEALRLEDLERCMRELIHDGETLLPRFDFHRGQPEKELHELRIRPNSVVIFEGIHAINPYFEQHLPMEKLFKLFVNTVTPIYSEESKLVARRQIRLTRRIVRDEKFRNSSAANTLTMWQQVIRGENEYMFPFVDTVDYLIDTTHAYEPCVLAPLLLPLLETVPADHPYAQVAETLVRAVEAFEPVSLEHMPQDALLREFVGPDNHRPSVSSLKTSDSQPIE